MGVSIVTWAVIGGSMLPIKCGGLPNVFPGYDRDAPVVVVDGRVLPGSEGLAGIRKLDPYMLEVSCWNPETGEFGVGPGIPLVRVVTRSQGRDLAALATAVVERQAEIRGQTGAYVQAFDDLALEAPADVSLDFESDGSTWRLTLLARFQRCDVSHLVAVEDVRHHVAADGCGLRPEEQGAALRRAYDEESDPGG